MVNGTRIYRTDERPHESYCMPPVRYPVSGMQDGDIRKKLKEIGWRGEQIRYAFKKIDGQRMMFEIPIFKGRENRMVRDEIVRRQQKPIDIRFIKRSGP